MKIDRKTLCAIADIVNHIGWQLDNLEDLMPYLNLSNDDKEDLQNAMLITRYKLEDVRKSKIPDLGDHIDDSINNVLVGNRY